MEEREAAIQSEKQLELETKENEHSKQLATLGRKLADTESELSGARERETLNADRVLELETKLGETSTELEGTKTLLTETQGLRDRFQDELNTTKEARDGLQTELDASRTKVEILEETKRNLESRVGSLEAMKSQLESKLSMAVEKIATDDELLSRVRKAMAIGLSLLEEQEQNTYGATSDESEHASEDAE